MRRADEAHAADRLETVMIDRVIDSRGLDSFDLRYLGLIVAILGVGVLSIYSVTHAQQAARLRFI